MSSRQYLTEYAPLFLQSPRMRALKATIEKVGDSDVTVLIQGESGVGKEIVARAIHAASNRHDRPFIKVNCAALPAELLESELFGHEKGAFPGAHRRKLGKFEFASTGTIFLGEIGALPWALQAELLHVLQSLEFTRVGSREAIRVDVRVLAASNRDLEAAVSRGEFREDLYCHPDVVEIRVPPLRERKEEIPHLASLFLARFNQRYRRNVALSPETIALFGEYSWPGNVRELEDIIRRFVVTGNPREILEIQSRCGS
ncbi:MAG: sigma 54-interacting transcriptional regulator [Acidobacteriota bacterium]